MYTYIHLHAYVNIFIHICVEQHSHQEGKMAIVIWNFLDLRWTRPSTNTTYGICSVNESQSPISISNPNLIGVFSTERGKRDLENSIID